MTDMTMMCLSDLIVGIDPGKNGAICIMDKDEKIIELMDLSDEPELIIYPLLIKYKASIKRVALEKVGAQAKDGRVSIFSFGVNVGRIKSACRLVGVDVFEVTPRLWQSWCNVYGTGDETKKRAFSIVSQKYGESPFLGPRGGLKDGRCDSVLIAAYINEKTNKK